MPGSIVPEFHKPWAKDLGDGVWELKWEHAPPLFVNQQIYEHFRDTHQLRGGGVERPQAPADPGNG